MDHIWSLVGFFSVSILKLIQDKESSYIEREISLVFQALIFFQIRCQLYFPLRVRISSSTFAVMLCRNQYSGWVFSCSAGLHYIGLSDWGAACLSSLCSSAKFQKTRTNLPQISNSYVRCILEKDYTILWQECAARNRCQIKWARTASKKAIKTLKNPFYWREIINVRKKDWKMVHLKQTFSWGPLMNFPLVFIQEDAVVKWPVFGIDS